MNFMLFNRLCLQKSLISFNVFFPNIIWKKTTDEKIWLTFDDGPEEEVTEFILKTLKKLNIKASFFSNRKKYSSLSRTD